MEESILISIKKLLGLGEDYTHFDTDIIMHINSVLMTLNQLGVGPAEGFFIEDAQQYWEDFIEDPTRLQAVKSYIYLKVRLLFDPPQGTGLIEAMERQAKELEWRLNVAAETSD